MSDWITDRKATKDDGDYNNQVWVTRSKEIFSVHWTQTRSDPWMPKEEKPTIYVPPELRRLWVKFLGDTNKVSEVLHENPNNPEYCEMQEIPNIEIDPTLQREHPHLQSVQGTEYHILPQPSQTLTVIVGKGTDTYQHALREATIIAERGADYHLHRDGGHPLGNAPGTTYSGTGYSWDFNRPNHCWYGELPESQLVARARVRGVNDAWFWSAHYK